MRRAADAVVRRGDAAWCSAVYAGGVFAFVSRSVSAALDAAAARRLQVGGGDGGRSAGRHAHLVRRRATAASTKTARGCRCGAPTGGCSCRPPCAERHPLAASARRWRAQPRGTIGRVSTATALTVPRPEPARRDRRRQPVVIQVARSEAPMRRELRELVLVLVLGLPFGVAAAGARRLRAGAPRAGAGRAGWRSGAQSITAERLSDRLPVDNPDDELGRLAGGVQRHARAGWSSRSSRCGASRPTCRTSCARR